MRPSFRSSNALRSFFIEYPKDYKSIMTQQCPVKKLHAVVLPPQPSPPEAGGEGVGDVDGSSDHKALNWSHVFPSPPMGERVRGK